MENFKYNTLFARIQRDQCETLEARLPKGFKIIGGGTLNKEKLIPQFIYRFESTLTKEQILDITSTLYDLNSSSWQFRAIKKTNPETGNTISADYIAKA